MGSYRFYILDDTNHIIGHRERACDDDLAALDMARFLSGDHPIELWLGTRLVAHVNRGDSDHSAAQAQSG
jgi:hypothetical protein